MFVSETFYFLGRPTTWGFSCGFFLLFVSGLFPQLAAVRWEFPVFDQAPRTPGWAVMLRDYTVIQMRGTLF